MSSEWINEMIVKATEMFIKWHGVRVKLWEYTPTHRTLTLRVESSGTTGNLHVKCGECSHIRGPFSWDRCNLTLRFADDEGRIVLADEQAEFELQCSFVSVVENVEPVYFPNMQVVTA